MARVLTIILFLSLIFPPQVDQPLIIVNKATNELAMFNEHKEQLRFPVATGKTEALTPEGLFTVLVKAEDPYYRKLDTPGGDPRNPLGSRWIGFDAKGTDGRIYGIHGTNRPESIGSMVSQGCIRMLNQDVEALFERVPKGVKVWVVNEEQSFESLYNQYLKNAWSEMLE
ncbi:L,D-transpeptidase [Thalassobacillus sp. CUG 92003]|uniref:L,D-transpeptidase n=1 Tax=Thalassobacillus sp. CUG 92003 TaxID=2736641 RepID=UPI0015E66053|nr:L,D-transpeptidase [Thalassobacillus sp. CUG 92003]